MQLPSSFCQNVDVSCWIWWVNACVFSSSCLEWMRKGGRVAPDCSPYAGCPLGWSSSWFLCSFSSSIHGAAATPSSTWATGGCRHGPQRAGAKLLSALAEEVGRGCCGLGLAMLPHMQGDVLLTWGCTSVTAQSILKGSVTAFLWIWSCGFNAGALRGTGTAFGCSSNLTIAGRSRCCGVSWIGACPLWGLRSCDVGEFSPIASGFLQKRACVSVRIAVASQALHEGAAMPRTTACRSCAGLQQIGFASVELLQFMPEQN